MAPVALSPMALPVGQPEAPAAVAQTQTSPRLAAPAPAPASLAAEYTRLAAGTPQQKFDAYTLTKQCLQVERDRQAYGALYERLRKERCGDLQPGQIAGRTEALIPAALAGAHNMHGSAYTDLLVESGGLNGPGAVGLSEEQLKTTLAEAHKAALANADWGVLGGEAHAAILRGDAAAAVMYEAASQRSLALDFPAIPGKIANPAVEKLAKTLPPAVLAQATADGIRLAEAARSGNAHN